ncbi:MAG: hypothetical protein ACJ736_25310 [Streptomyces sp.]
MPCSSPVGGCTYCYGKEGLAELSRPLHLIPDDMVSAAAGEVPSHWDDFPRLYRRLVPRIIRPLVFGQFHVSEELIATRLVEAGWSTWDAPPADALRNVWTAWWQATLHTHPSPVSIRNTLGLITVATDSLRPWLDIWTATRTPDADAHLADLMVDVLCGEGVPLQRGHRNHRPRQHPHEQLLDGDDVVQVLVDVGNHVGKLAHPGGQQANRRIAAVRVVCEHAFAHLKADVPPAREARGAPHPGRRPRPPRPVAA